MMRNGLLNHRVVVQTPTITTDDRGQQTTAWTDSMTLMCAIEQTKGGERSDAMQISPEATHVFTSHYVSGIKPKDRLIWDNRTFDIISVMNADERNRELRIEAKEQT